MRLRSADAIVRSRNRPPKVRTGSSDHCPWRYFIYDRPMFTVNLQRADRDATQRERKTVRSSRACVYPRGLRTVGRVLQRAIPRSTRKGERDRGDGTRATFDLSIRPCYPEGYIYPLPIQTNRVLGHDCARPIFRGRSRPPRVEAANSAAAALLLFLQRRASESTVIFKQARRRVESVVGNSQHAAECSYYDRRDCSYHNIAFTNSHLI